MRRLSFLLGLFGWSIINAHGALWENRGWALSGSVEGAVGYDSNLTLTNGGPGDGYVQASPGLILTRRNSLTDLHFDAGSTSTEFVNGRQPEQNDFRLSAICAYPNVANVIPVYRAQLNWTETSQPDQFLGQRIKHDLTEFTGERMISLSGKLGARGLLNIASDSYQSDAYNKNQHAEGRVGLLYMKHPGLEYSLNVGWVEGQSEPPRGNRINSSEGYITAEVRGEITPKITGRAYAGLGRVSYRGGYSNNYNLPVGGADLTWSIDPRRTLVLAAYSGDQYAPDGEAVNSSRAFLSFTNVIVGRWEYSLRGGPTHSVFRRTVRESTDVSWDESAEFSYRPSERFRAGLTVGGSQHRSDVMVRKYNRTMVAFNTFYRF